MCRYVGEEIQTKYAEYGYGDLKSDVDEKTEGPVNDLLNSLLSERLDFESRVLHRAMEVRRGASFTCRYRERELYAKRTE